MFDDIKRGAPPPRARDRGLSVRHLEQFFNPSIYSGFGDGENVSMPLVFCSMTITESLDLEFLHHLRQPVLKTCS